MVSPLTVAWLLCRTYRCNVLDWCWPIAGVFMTSYTIAAEPGEGLCMIGFDIGNSSAWLLRFLPKFALAMGIGLLMVKRAQQQIAVEACR